MSENQPTLLTVEQAYRAMFIFLDAYYQVTKADDVGALLGSMAYMGDGEPLDPALWGEWETAVQSAFSISQQAN